MGGMDIAPRRLIIIFLVKEKYLKQERDKESRNERKKEGRNTEQKLERKKVKKIFFCS